jgi:molybdenum cofactor cytidylyltransferase
MTNALAIIVLAAGSSSRLGQSKQLLAIKGEPLLLKSVNVAIASGVKKIVVVLGANDLAHRQVINGLPVEIIYNPTWQKGMGSSLKAGLSYLLETNPNLKAAITMVCDQPLISASHLKKLMESFEQTKSPIVASFYSGSAGVPVLFAKSVFENILSINDTHGAKKILQQHLGLVSTIDFPDGALDIDTKADIEKFL